MKLVLFDLAEFFFTIPYFDLLTLKFFNTFQFFIPVICVSPVFGFFRLSKGAEESSPREVRIVIFS